MERTEKLSYAVYKNYLPYAEEVITARAITALDGLKPVQRRSLYGMHRMGVYGKDVKSARAVGDVMGKYHPHGDSSIYDAICMMTDKYNALNVPYITGEGYFGSVTDESSAAAMRYTEVRLMPICKELFEGIDENAVDLVDNFDGTEKEPTILPVKYPTVLVSTTSGVAVGMSANLPSFNLRNVCNATIGVIKGTITNPSELADVLGSPEFTTGGVLHCSKKSIENLCATGKGRFVLDGSAATYPTEIVIYEIPYLLTAEKLIEEIGDAVKEGKLEGVKDADTLSDKSGFKISVTLKRNVDPTKVLNDIYRLTSLRKRISFSTTVIIDGEPVDLSILELEKKWIEFRRKTIVRLYKHRYDIKEKDRHEMEAWVKITGNIQEVVNIVTNNKYDEAKDKLVEKFGLTDIQVKYLLDFKLYQLTVDRAEKGLADYYKLEKEVNDLQDIINNVHRVDDVIIKELTDIAERYGTEPKTHVGEEITEEDMSKPVVEINTDTVHVVYTQNGFIKRLISLKDMNSFEAPNGDKEVRRFILKNNEHLLVFTYSGEVYKVIANSIDAGKGLTEQLYAKLGLSSKDDIMYIDTAGDYKGHINIIYSNGKYVKIFYSKISGVRQKYINVYEPTSPGFVVVTKEDEFLVLTNKFKASVAHVGYIVMNKKKTTSSRICRVTAGEGIIGVVPYSVATKNCSEEYIKEKYSRDYTILIREDRLWDSAEDIKNEVIGSQARQIIELVANEFNRINDMSKKNESDIANIDEVTESVKED